MNAFQRGAVIVVAALAMGLAFVLLRPEGADDAQPPTTQATTQQTEPAPTDAERTTTDRAEKQPPARAERPRRPAETRVRVRSNQPVGGVKRVVVREGQTVRFTVTADRTEEVHVHGYDLSRPVGPGRPARFRFPATLEGIFEVELEGAGVPVVELEVRP
jgi:hypothetical protein